MSITLGCANNLAGADVRLTRFDVELKGLEGERFELFRLAGRVEELTHV